MTVAAFAAFACSAQAQDRYTLLVFGDSGTGRTEQHRVARAMAQACGELDCDVALVLGDLIYPRGVKSVDDEVGRYLAGLVRDCGVQAYFAGHDHHQEHISFGFAIAAFTPSTMDVRFFDGTTSLAQEIYHCRAMQGAPECLPSQ